MVLKQKIAIFFLGILIVQLCIGIFQYSRYDVENYCCRHMSDDFERLFEDLGINTYQVWGKHYNSTNKSRGWDRAHRWLILDFGYFSIPFESTVAMPFADPSFWRGYEELRISEGYINRGRIHDELEWNPWI